MSIRAEDRTKAALLIVAIVAVIVLAVRPIIFRSKPTPAPSPVVTAPSADDPRVASAATPDIRVDQLDTGAGGVAPPINPFRQTVDLQPSKASERPGSAVNRADSAVNPMPRPGGLDGKLVTEGNTPLPPVVPAELEFRLEGVLIDGRAIAVVKRGGQTELLRVGSPAAYGYKIAEIKPIGIRVVQKNDSRWIRVGETFRFEESNVG